MSLRHAFDSLVVREDRLFGWGWLLDPASPVRRLRLVIEHADGSVTEVQCQPAGHRPDLAEVYPTVAHAAGSGFLMQARLRGPVAGAQARWEIELEDGRQVSEAIPGFPGGQVSGRGAVSPWRGRWLVARQLLSQGRPGPLLRRATAMLGRRLAGWRRRARARQAGPEPAAPPWLVFDHAMGGGANHFRDERVSAWRAQGEAVWLVTPHLPTQTYLVDRDPGGKDDVAAYDSLPALLAALPAPSRIVINSLVSWDDPLQVLDWIHARQQAGTPVIYYLHDYHPACPAWTLVDDTGRYCGIPPLSRCATCLPNNPAPFLGLMPRLDVGEWRAAWTRVLAAAEQRVAFSQASIDVLRLAFPGLAGVDVALEPHDTSYIRREPVAPRFDDPLVIAVVGQINRYKGAGIVREMVALIDAAGLPARVVVVGTLDDPPVSPALRITGPYRAGELPDLLRRERVGVCLLPSIWHETFSYVTSELMALDMPLAVFDLGAPAERVRGYGRGCIIPAVEARAALDAVFALRDRLAPAVPRLDPP